MNFFEVDGVTNGPDNIAARTFSNPSFRIASRHQSNHRSAHGLTTRRFPRNPFGTRLFGDSVECTGCNSLSDRVLLVLSGPSDQEILSCPIKAPPSAYNIPLRRVERSEVVYLLD